MTWGAFFYNFQGWMYVLALLSMIVSLVVYGLVRDDKKEGNENSAGAKKRKRFLWVMCSMSVVFIITMFGSCFYAQHIENKALTVKSNEVVKVKKIKIDRYYQNKDDKNSYILMGANGKTYYVNRSKLDADNDYNTMIVRQTKLGKNKNEHGVQMILYERSLQKAYRAYHLFDKSMPKQVLSIISYKTGTSTN